MKPTLGIQKPGTSPEGNKDRLLREVTGPEAQGMEGGEFLVKSS